jgi:carbon starvation protein
MNSLVILLISIAALICGYIFYGSRLAKKWNLSPTAKTPAHTLEDGQDYVPTKAPVLMGHHFASIAGAGPINGPIQAAVFGWVPVLLWIIIGGIFIGALQDFASLFASIRHKGRSIGYVIEKNMGEKAKIIFLLFSYITLLLIVSAFISIVIDSFNGFNIDGTLNSANGAAASTSLLFMLVSVIFGELVYRRNTPLGISTVISIAAIVGCIILGMRFPVYIEEETWLIIILVYIFIASVSPVWLLLQPRDYLNSFLLYAMMIGAVIGIVFAHPDIELPAFAGFKGIYDNNYLFPMVFTSVACGAVSGFHSLVGSGTTSKQINRETDAKMIGYGGMLIECALAVIALISVGVLFKGDQMPSGTPIQIFSKGIASMISSIGFENSYEIAYDIVILASSAFCLTSLDTATRLARYMFQEFFTKMGQTPDELTGLKKIAVNPYTATTITVLLGGIISTAGYENIWPIFGSSNQLLASLALLGAAAWFKNMGSGNKTFIVPMVFMLIVSLASLAITFASNVSAIQTGSGNTTAQSLQIVLIIILIFLALDLLKEGYKIVFKK